MGIDGLNKTIKDTAPSAVSLVEISTLPKGVYGVDVSIYLYPGLYNQENKGKGSHIRKFMDIITTWREAGHNLLMVFDGNTHNIKAKHATIEKRRLDKTRKQEEILSICNEVIQSMESTADITSDVSDVNDVNKYARYLIDHGHCDDEQSIRLEAAVRNNITVTSSDIQDLMTLFELTNTPYLHASGEADHLLADLYKEGMIDGVISEDGDMLTHGVNTLIRGLNDFNCRRSGVVKLYNLKKLLNVWNVTYPQFIDICILSGCDYSPKIKGVACKSAIGIIRKHGSVENYLSSLTGAKRESIPDDFDDTYREAVALFKGSNEVLPSSNVAKSWLKIDMIGDVLLERLEAWLLANTNYGSGTLNKKLDIFRKSTELNRVTEKTKIKVKVTVIPKKVPAS